MDTGTVQSIIYVVVAIVVALVGEFLRRTNAKQKLDSIIKSETLRKQLAHTAVMFVQQLYKNENGEEKLTKASEYLSEKLSAYGIKLTDQEIRALIESALKEAKMQFVENWENQPSTNSPENPVT